MAKYKREQSKGIGSVGAGEIRQQVAIVNKVSEPHKKIILTPRVGGDQYKEMACKCKNFKLTTNIKGKFKQCYNISLIKLAKAFKNTGSIMLCGDFTQ